MVARKVEESGHLERWLMSVLQARCRMVTVNLEEMKTRTALEIALFEVWNDFRWYLRRRGELRVKVLDEALSLWLRLLAPFAPHVCEELWSQMGREGFISSASWPVVDEGCIDVLAEEEEGLIGGVIEDTLSILRATKIAPVKVVYYGASGWKWRVFLRVLERAVQQCEELGMGEVMKGLLGGEDLRVEGKVLAGFVARILKLVNRMPEDRKRALLRVGVLDEKAVLGEAAGFLGERFNVEVVVFSEEDAGCYDPKGRASMAAPYHPAIYVE